MKLKRGPPLSGWIMSLPPELLIEIFIWCAVNHSLAPLTLQRVSKWWRALVVSSPRVWQHVLLDDQAHTTSFLRAQAELWLQRSMPLPIDVELNVQTPDLILPMLSPLLSHVQRWRSFVMQGQLDEKIALIGDSNLTNDFLTDLRISIQDDFNGKPHQTFFSQSGKFTMEVHVLRIPHSNLLAPLRITNLRLTEDSFSGLQTEPKDIIGFLSACPELQIFYFKGWPYDKPPPPDPFPVVSLPQLHTIYLKNICMTRAILSSIDTPRLANLYLAHLNTELVLGEDYHEDGDSDDEANDFSQSPSTDRATGMGLRTLINRCNPPIQVLDMDFSDLRTKDFRFIFDRLHFLQDFLIVASDMSDTVIGYLRPFTIPGEQTLQVRLPHLQSLGLYNCNRLSGDAVVEALSARVIYTDQQPRLVETLNNVAVVACDRIDYEHDKRLARLLGKRLRLS
ncbi:hypothetical protein DXG01_015183 [Tephrocybe rancida]|nr:hypothetical protein DXG01_015183 [Tephrocybe rancida]